jgi:hypothetical protein
MKTEKEDRGGGRGMGVWSNKTTDRNQALYKAFNPLS